MDRRPDVVLTVRDAAKTPFIVFHRENDNSLTVSSSASRVRI